MSEYDFEAWQRALYEVAYECVALLERKQRDYGPKNIANAPGGPIQGLMVRMYDKVARIENLTKPEAAPPTNESLLDSFMDLANYGIIGVMVLKGYWPGAWQYADHAVSRHDPHTSWQGVKQSESIKRHLLGQPACQSCFDRRYWENQEFH